MDLDEMLFELKNVCFGYPYEEPVLNNITMAVRKGERLCILGANGSGKSTLLKMLAGLIFPGRGEFKAFGSPMGEKGVSQKEYHKRVGFIFQDPDTQLFCSTAAEEIAFGPLQMGVSRQEALSRVKDIMELLGISHLRERPPFKLSGGEKKKVAIACVLSMNPQVLILDEPTNGLDPKTQRWMAEILDSLSGAGKTIITSTHNLELVQELSDRVIVLDESHTIAADGPTGAVLEDSELLIRVNLVDEYYHRHGDGGHAHFHIHRY